MQQIHKILKILQEYKKELDLKRFPDHTSKNWYSRAWWHEIYTLESVQAIIESIMKKQQAIYIKINTKYCNFWKKYKKITRSNDNKKPFVEKITIQKDSFYKKISVLWENNTPLKLKKMYLKILCNIKLLTRMVKYRRDQNIKILNLFQNYIISLLKKFSQLKKKAINNLNFFTIKDAFFQLKPVKKYLLWHKYNFEKLSLNYSMGVLLFAILRVIRFYFFQELLYSVPILAFCVIISIKFNFINLWIQIMRKVVKIGLGMEFLTLPIHAPWEQPPKFDITNNSIFTNIQVIIKILSTKLTLVIMHIMIYIKLILLQEPILYRITHFLLVMSLTWSNKSLFPMVIITIIITMCNCFCLLSDKLLTVFKHNLQDWLKLPNTHSLQPNVENVRFVLLMIVRCLDPVHAPLNYDLGFAFISMKEEELQWSLYEKEPKINIINKYLNISLFVIFWIIILLFFYRLINFQDNTTANILTSNDLVKDLIYTKFGTSSKIVGRMTSNNIPKAITPITNPYCQEPQHPVTCNFGLSRCSITGKIRDQIFVNNVTHKEMTKMKSECLISQSFLNKKGIAMSSDHIKSWQPYKNLNFTYNQVQNILQKDFSVENYIDITYLTEFKEQDLNLIVNAYTNSILQIKIQPEFQLIVNNLMEIIEKPYFSTSVNSQNNKIQEIQNSIKAQLMLKNIPKDLACTNIKQQHGLDVYLKKMHLAAKIYSEFEHIPSDWLQKTNFEKNSKFQDEMLSSEFNIKKHINCDLDET